MTTPADPVAVGSRQQVVQPMLAKLLGYMPLQTTGVDEFRVRYPTFDGRGVLIAILDSGIDVGVPGLQSNTAGERKVLDLRDFSGEARLALTQVAARSGTVSIEGRVVTGMDRVARLARPPYFAALVEERAFGTGTSADLNGNGSIGDVFALVVARGTQGWFVVADTDEDGDLGDESPVLDYLEAGGTFTFGRDVETGVPGPVTIAVNIVGGTPPELTLVFDNSGHGTHVAGIAAGRDLYNVEGFDGVAPGASLLGLKISDNTRGGITVSGSILRALNYAADFAVRRNMPLIANVSFGIGHEVEGSTAIDSIVDEFALKNPDVLVIISAGNDGPGISSIWLPGSAEYALSVCAMLPGVFAREQEVGVPTASDALFWWSSRGGEFAKPDVCAPGVAYSALPRWRAGDEISLGTSMAAPHVAGLAAVLQSGLMATRGRARAIDIKRALVNTATNSLGGTALDRGAGVAHAAAAYQWLQAGHRSGVYNVQSLPDGGNLSQSAAAYRRDGLEDRADTLQRFRITSVGGQPAARFTLSADSPWLGAPEYVEMSGAPVVIPVVYDATAFRAPGFYVGTITARPLTDTIAGPSFELVNTVIVPYTLDRRIRELGQLTPGKVARFFVDVPTSDDSPQSPRQGLVITLTARDEDIPVSAYFYEPTGRPARGRREISAGGGHENPGRLIVSPDEMRAGVYEVVVVGPDAGPAEFTIEIERSPIVVLDADVTGWALVQNTSAAVVNASITTVLRGKSLEHTVRASGDRARWRVDVPSWAARAELEVVVPKAVWSLVTDFGIIVYDHNGWKVIDAPLNYAEGRVSFSVMDHAGKALDVEFAPAFAHMQGPGEWTSNAIATFAPADTMSIPPPAAAVRIDPFGQETVPFGRPILDSNMSAADTTDGWLVDLIVRDGNTAWTTARTAVDPIRSAPDSIIGPSNE